MAAPVDSIAEAKPADRHDRQPIGCDDPRGWQESMQSSGHGMSVTDCDTRALATGTEAAVRGARVAPAEPTLTQGAWMTSGFVLAGEGLRGTCAFASVSDAGRFRAPTGH